MDIEGLTGMSNITLSICIASYNRKEYLERGVQELLKYPFDDLEVVVVDNASSDGAWEYIESVEDKRVKAIRNPENCGAAYNYSKALISGTGKYCQHLNDRDHIDCKDLEKYIEYLRECDSDVVITACQQLCMTKDLSCIEDRAYMLCSSASHAGCMTISQRIIEEYRRFWNDEIEEQKALWEIGSSKLKTLMMTGGDWSVYGTEWLVKVPERVDEVKQHRVVYGTVAYFTPIGAANCVNRFLGNDYIPRDLRKEISIGAYDSTITGMLIDYRNAFRYGCPRYPDVVFPKHVNYIKCIAQFYSTIKQEMSSKGYFNGDIGRSFVIVSVRVYVTFVVRRLSETKLYYALEGGAKRILPHSFQRFISRILFRKEKND